MQQSSAVAPAPAAAAIAPAPAPVLPALPALPLREQFSPARQELLVTALQVLILPLLTHFLRPDDTSAGRPGILDAGMIRAIVVNLLDPPEEVREGEGGSGREKGRIREGTREHDDEGDRLHSGQWSVAMRLL